MMVLVDTSIWIDHLRHSDSGLASLLEGGDAVCHPLVIGELACGHLHPRREILHRLALLPSATMARHPEVLAFIEAHRLSGLGLGFIDMHILAAAKLDGLRVWSRDKAMRAAAEKLKLSF
jgi:predicted nucleic acid-binding protein